MASYALIKFKINNDFSEWEQAFYGAQPMARKAGIIEVIMSRPYKWPSQSMVAHENLAGRTWIALIDRSNFQQARSKQQ